MKKSLGRDSWHALLAAREQERAKRTSPGTEWRLTKMCWRGQRETLTLLAGDPVLHKRKVSSTECYIVTRRAYETARPSWIINNAMLCYALRLFVLRGFSIIGKNQGYFAEIAESNWPTLAENHRCLILRNISSTCTVN
ncbi:hypothetical protein HN011_004237 [Eciton burchellii]|nr:hypothetical protein HN011_004237 [Eciton burchellii]